MPRVYDMSEEQIALMVVFKRSLSWPADSLHRNESNILDRQEHNYQDPNEIN